MQYVFPQGPQMDPSGASSWKKLSKQTSETQIFPWQRIATVMMDADADADDDDDDDDDDDYYDDDGHDHDHDHHNKKKKKKKKKKKIIINDKINSSCAATRGTTMPKQRLCHSIKEM